MTRNYPATRALRTCALLLLISGCAHATSTPSNPSSTLLSATPTLTTAATAPTRVVADTAVPVTQDEAFSSDSIVRADQAALYSVDWNVTATSVRNADGYSVSITVNPELNDSVAAPTLTVTSLDAIYPTTPPTFCSVDTENLFCPLPATSTYPATFVLQFPSTATQLHISVEANGYTEVKPADNNITLNLTT